MCLVRARQHWGLPKGHVERGETPQAAALREIAEECGISGELLRIVAELSPSEYVYRREGRLIFKLVHQFLVVTDASAVATPQLGEIDELAWLSFDDASSRASFSDTRRALTAARAVLDATG